MRLIFSINILLYNYMYLVWYILLNISIFCIFIFPIIYSVFLLNIKKKFNLININKLNKNDHLISFKYLYKEYSFFNLNRKNLNLQTFLITVFLNLKLFNINLDNYNPLFNYYFFNKIPNKVNYNKVNLNFMSNHIDLNNVNFLISLNECNNNYKNILNFLSKNVFNIIILNKNFLNKVNLNWITKFSPSNFFKYVNISNLNNYSILYLRKNKVFNKGRYSRNRQYYRTGVYWCLYVNIIAVVGIYFWFYRFTMNFGYLWWLLYLFIMSFIIPKTIKYRLYNVNILYKTLILNFIWLFTILKSFFSVLFIFYLNLNKKLNNLNLNFLFNLNFFFLNSYLFFFINFFKKLNYLNFSYLNSIEFKFINNITKFN